MPTPSDSTSSASATTGPPIVVEGVWKQFRLGSGSSLVRGLRTLVPGLARRLKVHEDFWAVEDVSFTVSDGEALGIIGHNGAGKSTLLRILCGVTPPTRGSARVRGRVAPLIEVSAGLHPELSGRENIYFNAAVMGMSRAETAAKFDAIVDFSGIEKFLDTPVKRYSSGMMVRLGFSVAVHIDPDVLLVDEVLAVGDLAFVLKSYRRIAEIRARGVPVILVTHNLQLVRNFCTRALWMDAGKLKLSGSPAEVAAAYTQATLEAAGGQALSGDVYRVHADEALSIADVVTVDAAGNARASFATGEELSIHMTLNATRATRPLVVVVTIWQEETGTMLVCHSTRDDGVELAGFSEAGSLRLSMRLARLPFIAGIHRISVSLSEGDVVHVVDWHEKMYSFRVAKGPVGYGAFHAFPEWALMPKEPA